MIDSSASGPSTTRSLPAIAATLGGGLRPGQEFECVRLIESGGEVVVTYETTGPDGGKGRNTEILRFRGDHVCRTEVHFGWEVQ